MRTTKRTCGRLRNGPWQRLPRRKKRRSKLHRNEGRESGVRTVPPIVNGFGMPPAKRDRDGTTRASDAGNLVTGKSIATKEETEETRNRASLENELKDKYSYSPPTYEFQEPPLLTTPKVLGRLRARIHRWEEMGASDFILDTLRTGYKLPFIDTPEPKVFRNNKSAMRNESFVGPAISELLSSGRVMKVDVPPKVVNPLSVSENGDKKRLILDLRYVNQHLWKKHVKFEDFKIFRNYIREGSFMFHFDFRSGYHHIDIFEEHWTYLGFSWTENGVTSYYVFIVLPFGLSTAPYIFTKVCRVLVKYWRANGIKIVIFIDDGIGAAGTFSRAKLSSDFVKRSIELSGFISNEEKSVWDPIQSAVWLGLEIDTKLFVLKIKEKRIQKVLGQISKFLNTCKASAREISSIAGGIVSQGLVLGPITGLFTREMYRFIDATPSWDRKVSTPAAVYSELDFWSKNLRSLNVRPLKNLNVPVCASIAVQSDASNVACAAIMKIDDALFSSHKNFSMAEVDTSSTWRELEAVRFSLQSFAPMLHGRVVNWETDNQAVPIIAAKGSKKKHLQDLAVSLYFLCKKESINLRLSWIPRDENTVADEMSRYVDYDDWRTSVTFFNYLNARWGPFTIDRFANSRNTKTTRYNALFWNPLCEAVDAFTQDWSGENNWLVPPVFLVPSVLHHARSCRASGTLVVPFWESAAFWPMLRKRSGVFKKFVRDYETFPDTSGVLELGDFRRSLLGSARFQSPIIAFRIQF